MPDAPRIKPSPYGLTDFVDIRRRALAYVDKTQFIEALENCGADYPFLVRPRRFGKTLSTSVLEAYYDEAAADRFESLFAGTYIGSHKTPLASKFRVLHLDFSGIASSDHKAIMEEFRESVLIAIQDYFQRYPHPDQDEVLKNAFPSSAALIARFFVSRP